MQRYIWGAINTGIEVGISNRRSHHRQGVQIKSFKTAWKNATQAANLPGRIPHDFRRTAVRNLEKAGVSRSVAMKLTGHLTESVYGRYAIVSESDLIEGVEKLSALHRDRLQRREAPKVVSGQFGS